MLNELVESSIMKSWRLAGNIEMIKYVVMLKYEIKILENEGVLK